MNILNEAVSQLMSEFSGIFEQVENLEENLNNNLVGNFNDNFASNTQNGGNLDHFITQTKSVHNNKFNSTVTPYKIGFNQNMSNFRAAFDEIKLAFENLTNEFNSRMGPHDKIRIVLYHDSLERPISIPFLKKSDMTTQVLIDSFERVAQSHREVQLNENNNLTAHVIIARFPSGSGRKIVNLKKRQYPYTKKKDRIRVSSDPTNEFQRFCENKPYVTPVFKNDNLLTRIVKELYLPNAPCGIEEIKRIETYLCNYQITIINSDGKIDNKPIYIGPQNNKYIYLCYTGTYYNVITSKKQFYNRSYYCDFCKVAYNNLESHKCDKCCKSCNRIRCNESIVQSCKLCKIECKSEKCPRIHSERFCKIFKICKTYNFYKIKNHVCAENDRWCKNCSKSEDEEHRCFIKKDKEKINDKEFGGFIFFDFEAYQINGVHVPNLKMAKKICAKCIDAKEECEYCQQKYTY
ncbi:unnamed protein product [Brachionus calyciflorus]|uniref:Uncharacterized protein n=1 Tax=Brachionus calyciflorus TaxID=104777 RepID=A0A814N0Y4_9BILA|nr:unnamed protein product [Brachionus calyciflorus]